MNKKENRHIIDILFVISLFCLFVVSAVFLISIGARIYSKNITNLDSNFSSRTAVAYITEKIRQSEEFGNIEVGDFQGCPCVFIDSSYNDTEYRTCIYEYEGVLTELLTRKDTELSCDAGQPIIEVSEFSPSKPQPNLLNFKITTTDNMHYDFNVMLHTEGGDSDAQ